MNYQLNIQVTISLDWALHTIAGLKTNSFLRMAESVLRMNRALHRHVSMTKGILDMTTTEDIFSCCYYSYYHWLTTQHET